MANLLYRVVSACGALGYGFPKESLNAAIIGRVDAIISDAGSMDAGPYFLGTGTEYFELEAVKADFRNMVEAQQKIGCPVILGSCGMAGGNRNLQLMLGIAKEVFAELGVHDAKVAVIEAELDAETVIQALHAGKIVPTGRGPELSEDALRASTIVGQMGIHPLITALDSGAQFVFAGRSCDIALFASDMIRRGIDPGLAYHVGHVLECGALACDPGSPSDCLVAEIYDDGSALFIAPNPTRRCTPSSIAAHSLYEESHPQLQFYPEGVLAMEQTEFFAKGPAVAGIRGSRFARAKDGSPSSIKLEGSYRVGGRRVSLIHIDAADLEKVPEDILCYGRNGVERRPVGPGERELGIIIETRAEKPEDAVLLASLLTHYLIHYGYAGRKATAGNIAYPLSPNLVSFQRDDGGFGAIVPSGTRDPVFFENYTMIKAAVLELIGNEFPDALANASYQIHDVDASCPAILLRSVDPDPARLIALHEAALADIRTRVTPLPGSLFALDAPDAYEWSLYHLLVDAPLIRERMFPIRWFRADGANWTQTGTQRPIYSDVGETGYRGSLDDRVLSLIADAHPAGQIVGERPLIDMASVIRSWMPASTG